MCSTCVAQMSGICIQKENAGCDAFKQILQYIFYLFIYIQAEAIPAGPASRWQQCCTIWQTKNRWQNQNGRQSRHVQSIPERLMVQERKKKKKKENNNPKCISLSRARGKRQHKFPETPSLTCLPFLQSI